MKEEAKAVFGNSPKSILLSSFTAGLEISFSFLLMCTVFTLFTGKVAEETIFQLLTFVYPAGFILVILGRSLLFTEQTSLLSLPVLNRKQSIANFIEIMEFRDLWKSSGRLGNGCFINLDWSGSRYF